MSTSASVIASPPRDTLSRAAWRLETPAGLISMFALGLLVRILIAPHVGFYGDLRLFRTWAGLLNQVGTHNFYAQGQFADYPPGYLYILWLTGKISATPSYLLLKLPAILADLGLAWIAGLFAARLAPARMRERWPVRALVAASVLFNPAFIALSAGWGQVDAVPAMFVLWALLLLFTGPRSLGREIVAFLLFAVAVAMKPQAGFVLPIMLYALYRRYLYRRSEPELVDGLFSIALIGVLSVGLWAVSGLPFDKGPVALIRFYRQSASVYPVTSANAFNLWGAIGFWRNDSTGVDVLKIAGIPALYVGTVLFLVGVGILLRRVHRALGAGADEVRALTVGAAVSSLLAYVVLTRMHERYMFLALACLAPLVIARTLRFAFVALCGLFVLNLWYPYAFFNSQWRVEDFHFQPLFGWLLGSFATETWQKTFWSLAVVVAAVWFAWAGTRWVERSRAEPEPSDAGGGSFSSRPALSPTRGRPATWLARWWPLTLVGLACLFSLVVLRGETSFAQNLNDSAFHMQMVRWADGQIGEGRVPLDGWYPFLSLGSSFFHHYQSLAETLTAYTARVTGGSDDGTYLWIQYLLLALWPISVYLGARLLDWGRRTSAAAAAVSPLIVSASGYGYEHGSYIWRGYGVYSQLWAMWLLPIAWGLAWQAVAHGKRYAAAAAALALTIACHFITGYLALLTVGVWVIVLAGSGFLRRVGRAALLAGGSLLVALWVLVPLIGDSKYTTQSAFYRGTIFNDSYGARKVLGWLVRGDLFDHGRFPIVTILVFAGIGVCVSRARRDPRARALLGVFTLSLLLFFGRRTFGSLFDVFPGFGDVQIHRFVIGVHLAGILLAGVGLAWLLRIAFRLVTGLVQGRYALVAGAAAALALAVGALAPAWHERGSYDLQGGTLIHQQQLADSTDGRDLDRLIAIVKARGDGRVYAGLRGNWGLQYVVGSVPVHAWLADRDVDAIGFTFRTISSLSTDVEASFDESNPAQYQMFNIRYLILPDDRQPSVPAKLIASSGRHRLWEVRTSGYFQVVDRSAPIPANRTNLDAATQLWRQSNLASQGIYPGIAFDGAQGPPATFTGTSLPAGPAGAVLSQQEKLADGVFDATVVAHRRAVVLLKATYDPRWHVTVDGLPDKAVMMAPSLVGVEVPPGRHVVEFRYAPYDNYPLLLAIGAITLLGLALYPRRTVIMRRIADLRRQDGDVEQGARVLTTRAPDAPAEGGRSAQTSEKSH